MKTKKEVITEAYGDFVGINDNIIESVLSNDGWIPRDFIPPSFDKSLFEASFDFKLIRPKSLFGIEYNNGWTSISSRNEMPEKDCLLWVCFDNKPHPAIVGWNATSRMFYYPKFNFRDNNYIKNSESFWVPNITHYKLYIEGFPPLF